MVEFTTYKLDNTNIKEYLNDMANELQYPTYLDTNFKVQRTQDKHNYCIKYVFDWVFSQCVGAKNDMECGFDYEFQNRAAYIDRKTFISFEHNWTIPQLNSFFRDESWVVRGVFYSVCRGEDDKFILIRTGKSLKHADGMENLPIEDIYIAEIAVF